MRRFLTLVCLLFLALPAGISISGCYRNPAAAYCNGAGYGMKITDVAQILIQPYNTGISMAFGQTRSLGLPQATSCKGATVSVSSFSYGSTNLKLLDISPSGNMCAGTWNRNTGGGVADYTICSPPNPIALNQWAAIWHGFCDGLGAVGQLQFSRGLCPPAGYLGGAGGATELPFAEPNGDA